ncbi:Cystathionine gamma-lyase [Halotydeus destructor]|nr:Cystathionine gamma-lyase [Halotydeus destructor]
MDSSTSNGTNGHAEDTLTNGHVKTNGVVNGHCPRRPGVSTAAIHVGQKAPLDPCKPVVPPLFMSTAYELDYPGQEGVYDYSRSGNPSRSLLEDTIAAIEKAKYGITFSSGLGASTAISYLLKTGDHVIVSDDCYGGMNRFFNHCSSRMGIEVSFVDVTSVEQFEEAIRPNTKMLWLESPTNPTMKIIDIELLSKLIKSRDPSVIVVVDNTFMSSYYQKPLDLGADISYQSLTKYINGHSDVVMGGVVTNSDHIGGRLKYFQNALGIVPSPFDCYMVKRGVKTLAIRMKVHHDNGLAVAKYLEGHSMVRKVLHPGLKSHPQRALAAKQSSGFSGMVSFYIDGNKETTNKFIANLEYFKLAVSLGGVQSLVEVPFTMSHATVDRNHCRHLGIDDTLVRLSVGIEDIEDLIDDLRRILCDTMEKLSAKLNDSMSSLKMNCSNSDKISNVSCPILDKQDDFMSGFYGDDDHGKPVNMLDVLGTDDAKPRVNIESISNNTASVISKVTKQMKPEGNVNKKKETS